MSLDDRFNETDKEYLEGINTELALRYNKNYDGWEISLLVSEDISPEEASKYPPSLSGFEVFILKKLKIEPENLNSDMAKHISQVVSCVYYDPISFSFIGTGSASIILFYENYENKEQSAWKFSQNAGQEVDLLQKLKKQHTPPEVVKEAVEHLKQKYDKKESMDVIKTVTEYFNSHCSLENVVKVKSRVRDTIAFELEYIQGKTLHKVIEEQGKLSPEKVLRYASGIMNGLIEMRQAGIWYHRDIRPANIMIDEDNDKAVIIDLGIATQDRHAPPKDNRRYGGFNDLISLGQVMYKMATGKHLFAKSQSMERTIYADQLKDHRDEVYANPEKLGYYLRKVDKNIEDERVKELIKECLTAGRGHYKRMHRMFKGCAA